MDISYAVEEQSARHGRVGQERRGAARRDVRRDLRRRAHRHRPQRGRRLPQGEGRDRHDRAQARRQPARVRRRHHRRGRQDRALPREADVGSGLLGHDQHRHLRDASPRSSTTSRAASSSTSARELFPLLMEKGYDLYGCVVDGYWCDIGSLGAYMQAHVDILDGKVGVYVPGFRTRGRRVGRRGREDRPDGPSSATRSSSARTARSGGRRARRLHGHRRQLPARLRRAGRTAPSCGTTASSATVPILRGTVVVPRRRHPRATPRVEIGSVDRRRDRRWARAPSSATTCRSTRSSASSPPRWSRARSSGRAAACARCSARTASPGSSASTSRPSSRCSSRRRSARRCQSGAPGGA